LDFFNPEDKVVPEASAPFQVDKLEEVIFFLFFFSFVFLKK